jgi:hypothetical protein
VQTIETESVDWLFTVFIYGVRRLFAELCAPPPKNYGGRRVAESGGVADNSANSLRTGKQQHSQ